MDKTDITKLQLATPLLRPLELVVVGKKSVATHTLPRPGVVVIGRASDADVCIDDPAVSRRHLTIRISDHLEVEDLGSANGTLVRGQPIARGQPERFSPGEPLVVSGNLLVVQQASTGRRMHRMWTHGYFEARLEEEVARAHRSRSTFALVRLNVEGPVPVAEVEQLLGSQIRTMDLLAVYRQGEYELLLVDDTPDQAKHTIERLTGQLRDRGLKVRVGVANFPADGSTAEALAEKAGDAALGHKRGTGSQRVIVAEPGMRELYALAEKAAASNINVLILGETGVGKEVLADHLHRKSSRADQPFVTLNCAAVAESLFESELFGHERGAFTGADRAKAGLIEAAQGGTLFLDEVGELSAQSQAKLLRVLERREVLRVGSTKPRPFDVRFVSATNADLNSDVQLGRFRRDLFFRLNGMSLTIPPLRARLGEIVELATLFANQFAQDSGRRAPSLSKAAEVALKAYAWPGNIRELRNVIERAVLISEGMIAPEHLPLDKLNAPLVGTTSPAAPTVKPFETDLELETTARHPVFGSAASPPPTAEPPPPQQTERDRIAAALDACAGNQTRAAVMLGISRRTLTSRLTALGFPRPRIKPT